MTLFQSLYPTPRDWRDADGPLGGGDTSTPWDAAAAEDLERRQAMGTEKLSDIDVTGAVSALTKIEQAASRLGSDGGVIELPPTRWAMPEGIKCDGLLELGESIELRGPGMRLCKLNFGGGDGLRGIVLHDVDSGSRGGWTGGFTLMGGGTAVGKSSRGIFQTGGVNTGLFDLRVENNPGIGFCFDGAQNITCLGLDVANDGTKYAGSIGYYFDYGASGINFFSPKSSFQQSGYVVFDQTSAGITREPSNITFYGNMLERNTTTGPAINVKAGMNISFVGGNISHGSATPSAEYPIVRIANDAYWAVNAGNGGNATTKNIIFRDLEINGSLGASWNPYGLGSTTRYATIWQLHSSLDIGANTQRDILTVGRGINPINCLNAFDVQGTNIAVRHEGIEIGQGSGGLVYIDKPTAPGRANAITVASGGTTVLRTGVDFYFITGNTTIANLTATYVRHRVTLKFASGLTINETGNIRIRGAATSLTVSAGDCYDAVFDGTYWNIG